MKTLSLSNIASLAIAGFAIASLLLIAVPKPASAEVNICTNSSRGDCARNIKAPAADNRPYSVTAIKACVATHTSGSTGTSTAEVITKVKAESLMACIKNARYGTSTSSAIEALLKKIDDLRKEIEALKNNN